MAELLPVDTSVKVPAAVVRAAAQADQMIERMKVAETPVAPTAPETPEIPVEAPVEQPVQAAEPTPAPEVTQEPPAQPEPQEEAPERKNWKQIASSWEGRYKQSMNTISGMQMQMREMGDEMLRLQEFVKSPPIQPNLVTDKDRETYGAELIDTVQRAALEAVTPKINQIEQENQNLKKTIQQQRTDDIYRTLDTSVPNWRSINKSDRFKQWLSLTNLLAGKPNGVLLNEAFKAANAPRLVAFFQTFINDESTTGSTEFAPTAPQPPQAPRQPAVALATLAAPGRAKPAAADTGKPADKPVFTRAQIANFYADIRAQRYAGREQEKDALEAQIFEAQREGRVR